MGPVLTVSETMTEVEVDSRRGATTAGQPAASAAGDPLPALMRRLQARDQAALGAIYDTTSSRLYAVAHAILRNAQDAEEAVFDCYSQCWEEASRYDPDRSSVMGWLTMMCRSRALDRLRRRRHERLHVDVEAAADIEDEARQPVELLSLLEEGSAVRAALALLPENRRELIGLAFLRGMSHDDIASMKRIPLGTVKSHLRRGLLQLREALGGTREALECR
jgi:RNA polymerase sigma-70 factor (ECF subfamily)